MPSDKGKFNLQEPKLHHSIPSMQNRRRREKQDRYGLIRNVHHVGKQSLRLGGWERCVYVSWKSLSDGSEDARYGDRLNAPRDWPQSRSRGFSSGNSILKLTPLSSKVLTLSVSSTKSSYSTLFRLTTCLRARFLGEPDEISS